jgi:hypothetical protein
VRRPLAQDYQPLPEPSTPSAKPASVAPRLPSRSASASPSGVPVASGPWLAPWVPWAAGGTLLGLLLAAQVGVVALRLDRSRRRRSAPVPSDRVRGAWLELLDGLRLAGAPPPAHLTATEVAGWAAARPGRLPAVSRLAHLANLVGFAPEWADEDDARAATGEARAYLRGLRRGQGLPRRLLWFLRPGPLRWRHGGPAAPGTAATASAAPRGGVRPAAPPVRAR